MIEANNEPGHHAKKTQRLSRGLLGVLVFLFAAAAQATAPSFTGTGILVPLTGGAINLRSQGAISGSAPMVIESVSILPLGLGVSATVSNGVCVQITNTLGIDLASAGVLLSVLVSNADAPRGVRGTMVVLPGLSSNNNLTTCADPSVSPVANAGSDRTVADTDGVAGEVVTLDGSASVDPDGSIASYVWTDLTTKQTLGTGATLQARLTDGSHQIQLTVTDNAGGAQGSASATVNIVVQAAGASGPTANAGGDRSVLDTDGLTGELVTLDASASISIGGVITAYEWFDAQQNLLGAGASISVRLPDGVNNLTLRVTSSAQLSNSIAVTISVASPLVGDLLESIPNLTPNQRSVAATFDNLCARLAELAETQALAPEAIDLLNRCGGIIGSTDVTDQIAAVDALGARELNAMRTQALLFSNAQYSGVINRLAAVRSGARGLSVRGVTMNIDGQPVPVEPLRELAKTVGRMLGGGASADEAGSLLSERLGIWLRGNHDRGERLLSPTSNGFDARQWGMTGGIDYRFGQQSIAGFAMGYGKSDIDFNPVGRGDLATKSWTASVYGTAYPLGDLYVDAVLNYGRADYDSTRHVVYEESGATIDRTALGRTQGDTVSGGFSVGWDWNLKGFTLSPALGYFRSHVDIDAFDESGAQGLDLAYEDQSYVSSTANFSLALNYAWNTRWLVLLPHVRGEYLHEFANDVEVFGVRFAHDPFANTANPTPPVVVRSDVPDQWYWRLAAGVSAQFKYGLSAYAEYQRLEDFQFVNFESMTLGLRMQRSF